MALFAGQGVGSVTEIRPARTIVRDLANGAESLLAAASSGNRQPSTS